MGDNSGKSYSKSIFDYFNHTEQSFIMHRTCILGEADGERRSEDFLLEEIFLVEEENNGGIAKPLVVTNGIKRFTLSFIRF